MIFHPELLQISNVQRHPHHQQEPSFMETAQLIHTFIQWSYHMLHPLYFSLTILVEFQQKRANWCQLFVLLSSGPFVPSTSVSLDPSETCFIFCQGLRVKMIQNEELVAEPCRNIHPQPHSPTVISISTNLYSIQLIYLESRKLLHHPKLPCFCWKFTIF